VRGSFFRGPVKFDQRSEEGPAADEGYRRSMDTPVMVVPDLREISPMPTDKLGHTTALKSPDVRVVILTFPAGHVMKDHATPKTLLLQTLDGHVRLTVDGEVTEMVPGALMRLDPGVRHEVEAVGESRLKLTLVG